MHPQYITLTPDTLKDLMRQAFALGYRDGRQKARKFYTADTFWMMVEKTTDCWLWTGNIARGNGYGYLTFMDDECVKHKVWAHRLAYTLAKGAITDGLLVCHTCDVRSCVNPDHLFLGTHRQNLDDMVRKGRSNRGVEHARAKLTPEMVRELRRRHERGESTYTLAGAFGIHQSTAWDVIARKIWKHVE